MKKSRTWSAKLIWIILIISIAVNIINTRKIRPDKVFVWDIKSYYAYLPAAFIHGDLQLEFLKKADKKYNDYFWPSKLENGNKLIITSMGLSMLYSPFFMLGHAAASISSHDANGYTRPYAFALIYSILFYVIIGLVFLRKILRYYFDDFTTSITLLAIYFGTNLLYYSLYIPMSHAYSFALYAVFIWYTIKWHKNQKLKYTLILGALYGLISLIRPTNAIIILIFILYNVASFKQLGQKILFFLNKWKHVLILMALTFLIWVPQMLYWKEITGHYIYYSYGVKKTSFFWDNPQLFNALLSFRKGWLVYTPIMTLAMAGIVFVYRKYKEFFVPIIIFVPLYVFIQSSWWSWWFGGGYGNRAFVDFYPLLAISLGALIQYFIKKTNAIKIITLSIVGLFILLNVWNIIKYNHVSVHYYWNSRISYLENLFHLKPTNRYWRTIPYPDYEKARDGIYVAENLIERYDGKYDITPEMILSKIKSSISRKDSRVSNLVEKHQISTDSAVDLISRNIYELNYSLRKYIEPIESRLQKKINEKYKPVFEEIKDRYDIHKDKIAHSIHYPSIYKYVTSEVQFDQALLSSYYNATFLDSINQFMLYEVSGAKESCIITEDMENKKKNRVPTTCKTDYSIILPERVFENCFTGDWASTVGNTLDKSIRISLKNVNQKYIYLEFWKKGKSDFTIDSNQSNFDKYLYKSSVIKGHWEKQEILVKLKTESTQLIQLVIKSEDNKMFIADDLAIYMLNN